MWTSRVNGVSKKVMPNDVDLVVMARHRQVGSASVEDQDLRDHSPSQAMPRMVGHRIECRHANDQLRIEGRMKMSVFLLVLRMRRSNKRR
jgi:hypothetical protein